MKKRYIMSSIVVVIVVIFSIMNFLPKKITIVNNGIEPIENIRVVDEYEGIVLDIGIINPNEVVSVRPENCNSLYLLYESNNNGDIVHQSHEIYNKEHRYIAKKIILSYTDEEGNIYYEIEE